MAWNCGYIFLAGVLATVMTAAYTMAEYVVAIANVLITDPERQITNHGITIGIYIGILLLSVIYCYQGIRFSGYLNVFTGKSRKEGDNCYLQILLSYFICIKVLDNSNYRKSC